MVRFFNNICMEKTWIRPKLALDSLRSPIFSPFSPMRSLVPGLLSVTFFVHFDGRNKENLFIYLLKPQQKDLKSISNSNTTLSFLFIWN